MNKLISVVTGSRADFGLLQGVISRIHSAANLELELIVTGSHLSESFGSTKQEISVAGYEKVVEMGLNLEMISESDTGIAISDLISQMTRHYSNSRPSLTLVLGDRYEILGAAVACAALGIPLGHIHGGEVTSGSKDDMYRHAITKLASLHFVANSEFQSRVVGMGENPNTVYVVGGLGVDSIDQLELLSNTELEIQLGISLSPRYALVTYHPDTINPDKSLDQLDTILRSIAKFPEIQFIITGANADYYGDQINLRLKEEAKQQTNVQFFNSVGQQNYLSLLSRANFVLGNSSSGLLEAPSFGTTTINIGGRQDGRPRASSVVDVECEETHLVKVIQSVISASPGSTLQSVENAYGNPGASKKITEILDALDLNNLLPKRFFDLK
jgi:GDP/UDP-N,N'-diacetylbacillosamine 2-epimerase (hydrolysing)